MCMEEFCCFWSPSIEGEGPIDSPKFKPTYSGDLLKKTLGTNNSGAKVASTSPSKEKTPEKTPVVGKSNEKVAWKGVHPSSLAATINYDSEESARAQPANVQPKEGVPRSPAKFTDAVGQQPQSKIVSIGEITAKGRTKTTDEEVDEQSLW